ncbi:hypothetical protein Tco_0786129 [Tanacetum coccineum]
MTTLAKNVIVAGADNHPPLLEKSMYNSWQSRMILYIKGKEHGRMILDPVLNGPLVYGTIEVDSVTKTKTYKELSDKEKLQDDCTELSQLEREWKLYNEFDRFTSAKGESLHEYYLSLQPEWSKFVTDLDLGVAVPSFLPGDDPNCQSEQRNGISKHNNCLTLSYNHQPNKESSNPRNQATIQDDRVTVQQCTQPKWPKNSKWFKEKILLVQAQESGQTDDLDAFDSDCDEVPSAKAVLMNLYNYDSDVISETDYSEQPVFNPTSDIKITSDSSIISYDQYLKETKSTVLQNTTSTKQQNDMIMSVIAKISSQVAKCNVESLENKNVNESLTTELERYKERQTKEKEDKYIEEIVDLEKKKKELDNIVYKVGQSVQTMHMLTEQQVFYDDNHKTTLGYQNPFYLKKAQRIKPMLYDGSVLTKKHDVISMVDYEETLMLAEESRSKIIAKQNNPISKEKKVNICPISYAELNKLSEQFEKHFVPQKELSTEQDFWLPISNPIFEQLVVPPTPVKTEVPRELLTVVKVRTTATTITVGTWGFEHTKDVFIAEVIPFMNSLRESFKDFDNGLHLELNETKWKLQLKSVLSCNNPDASAFKELFVINDLKAQLQAKESSISKLRAHIATLKGKSMPDNNVSIHNANVIAPEMFRIELEPLSLKLNSQVESKKLVVVIPKNRIRQVRFLEPKQSTSNTPTLADSQTSKITNKSLLTSTGMKSSTSASGSQPSGNTKKNRILSAKSNKKKDWKPTGKVFTSVGYRLLPIGQTFTIDGTKCPMTRITSTKVVPPKETSQTPFLRTVKFDNDQVAGIEDSHHGPSDAMHHPPKLLKLLSKEVFFISHGD